TGDKADHRLLAATLGLVLEELGGVFLGGTTDLADHDDRLGVLVGQEHLQHVDELGALVLPILVPRRINKLSLKVTTPLLTRDTVKDDINVLDWTIDVAIPPKAKPPNGITVTLPIHLESLSRPKLSISLLKLCSP